MLTAHTGPGGLTPFDAGPGTFHTSMGPAVGAVNAEAAMPIKDYNCDPDNAHFARQTIMFPVDTGETTAASRCVGSVVIPFAGRIVSAKTDARESSGSVTWAVRKNGSNITTGAISTTGTVTVTALAALALADGDVWDVIVTHNAGPAAIWRGGVTLEIRPKLSALELTGPLDNE